MYKDIEPLMKFLTEHDVAMDMTTNGLLLNKYIDTIFNYNINSITISIDTIDPERYHKIRGIDCFEIVFDNVKRLLEKKVALKLQRRPYINVNIVLIKENLDQLEEIYQKFEKEFPEITAINFEVLIAMSETLGKDYEAIMKEHFQSEVKSWRWFYNKTEPFTKEELELMSEKLNWLRQQDKSSFMANTSEERFKYAFTEEYCYGKELCVKPYTSLSVLPNGDVTFCVDFPDYILGNIYESTIDEIWYSERARKFQEYLFKENIPICARCPHSK